MAFTRFLKMQRLMHSCTHSQTDRSKYSLPMAPFFNRAACVVTFTAGDASCGAVLVFEDTATVWYFPRWRQSFIWHGQQQHCKTEHNQHEV